MTLFVYIAAGLFLLLHGLVHLMGLVAYWPIAELKELPYKTTLLGGRWDIGRGGTRICSLLWAAGAIAFSAAALGLALRYGWWRPCLLGATLYSLVLTVLDWSPAWRGAIINAVILTALAVSGGESF
ncbi:ABC transporter permease [candidate division KSB1 bacterium]